MIQPIQRTSRSCSKTSNAASGAYSSREWLDPAPKLKLSQFSGVGHLDAAAQAAHDHGITVTITPEGTGFGVAENTIRLILALYKHVAEAHQALREGRWIHTQLRANSYFLYDKVLGIVGLGRIGLDVVERAKRRSERSRFETPNPV